MEIAPSDFQQPTLHEALNAFLSSFDNHGPQFTELARRLRVELEKTVPKGSPLRSLQSVLPGNADLLQSFTSFPAPLIAQQMTLIDFDLFSMIQPIEFLDEAWNKPKLQWRSPNLIRFIQRTNKTSLWVASTILQQSKLFDRVDIVEKFIYLAEVISLSLFLSFSASNC
jgi:hypothetical protein